MSRSVDPRVRAREMNAGSQISALLNPVKPAPKGGAKAPNHALNNRQALKAAQVRNQLKRDEEEAKAAEAPFKMARFRSVESVLKQKSMDGTLGLGAPRMDTGPESVRRPQRSGATSGTASAAGRRSAAGAGGLTAKMGGLSMNGARGASAASANQPRYDQEDDEGFYSQQQHPPRRYDDEQGEEDEAPFDDEQDFASPEPDAEHDERRGGYDDEYGAQQHDFEQQPQQSHYGQQRQQYQPPQQQGARGRSQPAYADDNEGEESLAGLMAGRGAQAQRQQPPSSLGNRGGISAVPRLSMHEGASAQAAPQSQPQHRSSRSFVAENAKRVIASSKALASSRSIAHDGDAAAAAAAPGKHENYGRVPAYLQEQKAAMAAKKAEESAARAQKDANIPDGMVLMPEDQRRDMLAVLQQNHAAVLQEIAAFPLRVETASRIKAKQALEAKLMEIEQAMALFNRKRVLIQP